MKNLQKLSLRFLLLINLVSVSFLLSLYNPEKVKAVFFTELIKSPGYCWDYPVSKTIISGFASDNEESLYISSLEGKLVSIDIKTSIKLWETDLGGEVASTPLAYNGNVYVVVRYALSRIDGNIKVEDNEFAKTRTMFRSIDQLTGLTNWETQIPPMKKAYIRLFRNSLIIVGDTGSIYSVNKNDGRVIWNKFLNSELSSAPIINLDKLVLGSTNGKIIILSMDDGLFFETGTATPPTVIAKDRIGNIVWGDERGAIISFNAKTNLINWSLRKGAKISGITVTQEGLLFSCLDNFVYMISENNGKIIWKKRFTGRMYAEPLVHNNYAVIVSITEPEAFAIDLKNGKLLRKFSLEGDNLFTSDFIKFENLFIYSTLRGISAVFIEGGCSIQNV